MASAVPVFALGQQLLWHDLIDRTGFPTRRDRYIHVEEKVLHTIYLNVYLKYLFILPSYRHLFSWKFHS